MAEGRKLDQSPWVPVAIGAWLIFVFWLAATSPAGEYPPAGYVWFTIALDALLPLILSILVLRAGTYPAGLPRALAVVVGGAGVLAGIGKLAIRFTSDHGWWTGNYLPPVFN
jgi:hypothetical protein